MLSQCCMAYAYPFVGAQEKALIRESLQLLHEHHPDYQSRLLAVPLPCSPCPGLAIGLANGICAVDQSLKASISRHIATVCDFLELLITELHLDQTRITNTCEAFALKHISKDTITLTTLGMVFSMLIAFIEAEVPADAIPLKKLPKRKQFLALLDVEPNCNNIFRLDNKTIGRAWWKLARYVLACMAETLDTYGDKLRQSETDSLDGSSSDRSEARLTFSRVGGSRYRRIYNRLRFRNVYSFDE